MRKREDEKGKLTAIEKNKLAIRVKIIPAYFWKGRGIHLRKSRFLSLLSFLCKLSFPPVLSSLLFKITSDKFGRLLLLEDSRNPVSRTDSAGA